MQQNKTLGLSLGALACAGLLMLSLGMGKTYARYDNTASCSGIYAPETPALRSNFLAPGGQTVLMEDWDISRSSYQVLTIQLAADTGHLSGTLQCQTDSQLLTVTLDQSHFTLGQQEQYAILTVSRTAAAALLTEPAEATVRVGWLPDGSDEIDSWADFKVTLLPSEQLPVEFAGQQTRGTLTISHPETFSREELLPLNLTLPEGTQWVQLSCDGGGFPVNTRYIADGQTPLVLANEMMIAVPTDGQQKLQLLLDFGWTEQIYSNSMMISAVAYANGTEIGLANISVSPTRETLAIGSGAAGCVMKTGAQLQLPLQGDLDGFVWQLERLTKTDGITAYIPDSCLTVTVKTENTTKTLVVSNDKGLAPAGTYRLTLQRTFEGAVVNSFEVFIFICY